MKTTAASSNRKVLLHERKRHTARHVSSTPLLFLSGGYPIQSCWRVPHPVLLEGSPSSPAGGFPIQSCWRVPHPVMAEGYPILTLLRIGGSKGGARDVRPSLGPNSFIFMQFLGKFWPINRLVPPPWGLAPLLWEILDWPLLGYHHQDLMGVHPPVRTWPRYLPCGQTDACHINNNNNNKFIFSCVYIYPNIVVNERNSSIFKKVQNCFA